MECSFGGADLPIDDIAAVCLLVTTMIRILATKSHISFWTLLHIYKCSLVRFMPNNTDRPQVYFGVSTLLDASSSDGLKAEEEQREVTFLLKADDILRIAILYSQPFNLLCYFSHSCCVVCDKKIPGRVSSFRILRKRCRDFGCCQHCH